MNKIDINFSSPIALDKHLISLLNSSSFVKIKNPKSYENLINLIEDFLTTYQILRLNINNIYLHKSDIIKPFILNKQHHTILIDDLRDKLERILKYSQSMIYIIPSDTRYLDGFYKFNQLLKSHLSRYYNRILSDYNFNDHTSQYELIRSSENKYGFIDWI